MMTNDKYVQLTFAGLLCRDSLLCAEILQEQDIQ